MIARKSKRSTEPGVFPRPSPRIGLALGGGAARGIGHIPVLEALDDLGVRPSIIAGTSIGSILGACYAMGLSGRDIREHMLELFSSKAEPFKRIAKGGRGSWQGLLSPSISAMFDGVTLFEVLLPAVVRRDFSLCRIPLKVIATDFYAIEQVVIDHGPIIPAVAASSALPGLFKPIVINDRVLIDGGFVNPTPYDVIMGEADLTLAVDVTGDTVKQPNRQLPTSIEAWVGAAQITLHSITREKLKSCRPDILIRPQVGIYGALDFYKVGEILEASAGAREETKRRLAEKIEQGRGCDAGNG